MSLTFRFLQHDEYSLAARFIDEHWARNHVYVRYKNLFDWSFGLSDLWDKEGYSFACAIDNGQIYGILGAIPFRMNSFGNTYPALWMVNWSVAEAIQGTGAGSKLYDMFRREPYRAIICFNLNEKTVRVYQKWRWRVLPNIPRHIAFLPGLEEQAGNLLHLVNPDWDSGRIRDLISPFTNDLQLKKEVSCTNISMEQFWQDWDEHGWSLYAPNIIGAARDSSYLRWRYRNHPLFYYRFIATSDDDHLGLAVWRLETIHVDEDNQRKEAGKLGRLVEFLPTSKENAAALLTHLMTELRDTGAMGIDYYGFNGKIGSWLHEMGFNRVDEHPDGTRIPSRFQPLDGAGGSIMCSLATDEKPPAYPFSMNCPWYWTKSDSDQDRPN